MVLLGKHAFIFDGVSGRSYNVKPFDPSIGRVEKVPIVDDALAYNCPYTYTTYVCIFKNALHIPRLEHNLIPPFILREAGLIVNDIPKLHLLDPSADDHAIIADNRNLRIPLQLNGIFSFFHTRRSTDD